MIASTLPAVEPEVRAYLNFFSQVQDIQRLRLSTDARKSLALSNAELRSLLTITADLATESRALPAGVSSQVWADRILDHVQQLKAALGEQGFQRVDSFIQSGNAMFEDCAIATKLPIVEPPAGVYLKFFVEVNDLDRLPLSTDFLQTVHLSDQDLRSLFTITADLAAKSQLLAKALRPFVFEGRLEVTQSGSTSSSLEGKLRDFQSQWSNTILDHVQRLRSAFGEQRFQELDGFIQSGKSMLEKPAVPVSN